MFNLSKTSRMKFYAAILVVFVIVFFNEISFSNPLTDEIKSISIILLFTFLVIFWGIEIQKRVVDPKVKRLFLFIVFLMILFNYLKIIRYKFFRFSFFSIYLWYMYYIPLIFIPLIVVHSTLLITSLSKRSKRVLFILYTFAAILAIGILTNNIHHFAFYNINYVGPNETHSYGFLYYTVYAWMFILAVSSIIICYNRSKNTLVKRKLWVQWIWIILAVFYTIYYVKGPIFLPKRFMQLPEFMCLVFIGFIEFSIQAGLYPSNGLYPDIFDNSSISAIIRDENNNVAFKSEKSNIITDDMQNVVRNRGLTLFDDKLVHYEKIEHGEIIWLDDVKSINLLTGNLKEIKEQISGENELLKAENNLKSKETAIREKTKLYSLIDDNLASYFTKIKLLLSGLKPNSFNYNRKLALASFYLAYIKRRSNLIILAQQSNYIDTRELFLSVKELLLQLKNIGIVADCTIQNEYFIQAESLIIIYQLIEEILEDCLDSLEACFININCNRNYLEIRVQLSGKDMEIDVGDIYDQIALLNVSLKEEIEMDESYFNILYKGEIL